LRLKPATEVHVIKHAHLFCGIGVGAKGFNLATPRVANIVGKFECIGGIDVDKGAIKNFRKMTGVDGTVMDLFDEAQYLAFHGKEPPPWWKPATPLDIWMAFGHEVPDVMFLSAPCKGFSGLLAAAQSATDKYQALNALTLRGIWLTLEAYKDNPIPIILFENVPRIATRGRWLLDQIIALLRHYGYSVNEDTHDCGVIGGLAQSRKRFLLIARHASKVPAFVYQPEHHRLRGVGEVIGKLPLPGDPIAGAMHRVPALQWKTWVRLAFVPAGKDWRALNSYAVTADGVLADYGIMPDHPMRDNQLGVCEWEGTAPTITTARAPGQGKFSVADPRPGYGDATHRNVLGVNEWEGKPAGVISGAPKPTTGANAVADPRVEYMRDTGLGVHAYDDNAGVIGGRAGPTNGAYAVADIRVDGHPKSVMLGVRSMEKPAGVVKGDMSVGTGPYAVADPALGRVAHSNVYRVVSFEGTGIAVTSSRDTAVADPRPEGSDSYTSTKYKVTPMEGASRAVIGASTTGDGAFAVADPRPQWGNTRHRNILRVTKEDEPSGTIGGQRSITGGQGIVADSRREAFDNGGHYGVVDWKGSSGAVPGFAKHDRGRWSVAEPRDVPMPEERVGLPEPNERLVCRIISMDETWHRPFTTLDLAALQSLFDPEEAFGCEDGVWFARTGFDLDASSDVMKREWIGNAVPGAAARGMAETIGEAIILSRIGESFTLSSKEIWVKPGALALAVDNQQYAFHLDSQ
jgi:site-specific DNA-cytosine methylase